MKVSQPKINIKTLQILKTVLVNIFNQLSGVIKACILGLYATVALTSWTWKQALVIVVLAGYVEDEL